MMGFFRKHVGKRVPSLITTIILFTNLGLLVNSRADATEIKKVNELGPVKVTTTLTPKNPTIGDEIQLEIKVEYPLDVEVLMPEFGEALSRYSILDFVPRQHIADDGSHVATQRYTLQPYLSGDQLITPILVEFIDNRAGKKSTPDDADAFEILTDRIDFNVKSVLPTEAANELKPPMGELEPPRELTTSSLIWLFLGGLLLIGAAIFIWVYLRGHKKRVIRQSAYEIARRKLDQLLSGGLPGSESDIEQFFVSISSIVRKYLEDRFDMHAPDLTTEEFLALAAKSREISNEHQRLLRGFLKHADLVKFAGVRANVDETEKSRDVAIKFLEDTRENAPLIQLPPDETDAIELPSIGSPPQQEEANV